MIMSTKFLLHLLDIKGLPKSYESGYGNTNLQRGSKPDVSNYRPVPVPPMLSTHGKPRAQPTNISLGENKINQQHLHYLTFTLELAKASETRNHKILITKLQNYRISCPVEQ